MKELSNFTTLFSLADDSVRHQTHVDDFWFSLYKNILFQDKLVLPLNSVYNSVYLHEHIKFEKYKNEQNSFVEESLLKGLLIPSFHDTKVEDAVSEMEKLKELHGSHNHHAFNEDLINYENFERFRTNLDDSLLEHSPYTLPEQSNIEKNSGEKYLELVEKYICCEDMTRYDFDDSDSISIRGAIWHATKELRIEGLNLALEATDDIPRAGLRRGVLFKKIAELLNIEDSEKGNGNDVGYILNNIPDPEFRGYVKIMISWLNRCYQINLSDNLEVAANFPKLIFGSDHIVQSELRMEEAKSNVEDGIVYNTHIQPVIMPNLEALKMTDPKTLIHAREGAGNYYLKALKAYIEKPESDSKKKMLECLDEYASIICTAAKNQRLKKYNFTFFDAKTASVVLGVTNGVANAIGPQVLDPSVIQLLNLGIQISTAVAAVGLIDERLNNSRIGNAILDNRRTEYIEYSFLRNSRFE